jgi:hypothetical protein
MTNWKGFYREEAESERVNYQAAPGAGNGVGKV